ncbi:MAG TPA: hypothetical protein V6C95_22475, partial [Coleofasciculaceae cyanobacterium]
FCFLATASTLKGFGLTLAPQTDTVSPTAICVEISRWRILCNLLIQGMLIPIAPSSFPGLPIFLRRCIQCKLWC